MNKSSALIVATALGAAAPAQAGSISLNSPFGPGPTFKPLPGDQVEVTSSGWVDTVAGYRPPPSSDLNFAYFGPLDFTGQLTRNYDFTGSATESLSFNQFSQPALTATIAWNTTHFVDDGSAIDVLPKLFGTGIVLTSSGDDAFEADFPVGGTFSVTADFLAECDRFGPSCVPNQVIDGLLINGAVTPIAVPSPPIGHGWLTALLTLALLTIRRFGRSS